MKKISFLVSALFMVMLADAQDTLAVKQLDEVIVTGQYKPQSIKKSVYQTRVITAGRIEKQGASKLQDVLSSELNIRFAQDLATGGTNTTMMGMKGQNVKILLDGIPVVGRQGMSNEFNINQIDLNTVDRIEIVEGPMSVIYGADALAGVINIITKKISKSKFSVTAKLHEETIGKAYSLFERGIHDQNLGATYRYKQWSIGGNIGYHYFGGWKGEEVGRELEWHKKDQITGAAFLQFQNSKLHLNFRFDGLDEKITNPGNFVNPQVASNDTLANDQEYYTQRAMQQLQAGYQVNDRLSLSLQSGYTVYGRQVVSSTLSKKTGAIRENNAPGANSVENISGFTFRSMLIYKLNNTFSFQPGVDVNMETGDGERLKTGENRINDYALFITSEITASPKISLKPGLRFTKNSNYNAPVLIPSINSKFILNKNLDLRASYGNGFRAPSMRELYFNFIDANHTILGNPNLKAEVSNSFNASLNWNKVQNTNTQFTSMISGFYNDVKNLIDYAASLSEPGKTTLINVSHSKSAGVNWLGTFTTKSWNISIGAAYTGFNNEYAETEKNLSRMLWSPEATTTLGYSFSNQALDINLYYKFTGKRPLYAFDNDQNLVLTKYDAFSMADFTVNKKLCRNLKMNIGIRNLFNVTSINSNASVTNSSINTSFQGMYQATGRGYFAGLIFNWAQ